MKSASVTLGAVGAMTVIFASAAVRGAEPPPLAPLPPIQTVVPADNPMTPQKIELGKMLYFDPPIDGTLVRLFDDEEVDVASCTSLLRDLGTEENDPLRVILGNQTFNDPFQGGEHESFLRLSIQGRPPRSWAMGLLIAGRTQGF